MMQPISSENVQEATESTGGQPLTYRMDGDVKVFDLTVASTGLNQRQLEQAGLPFESVIIHSNSHASYYPGAAQMALKLLFSPEDGRIYGAQAVGPDGVDKRIDVMAAAIKGKLSVYDLEDLERVGRAAPRPSPPARQGPDWTLSVGVRLVSAVVSVTKGSTVMSVESRSMELR